MQKPGSQKSNSGIDEKGTRKNRLNLKRMSMHIRSFGGSPEVNRPQVAVSPLQIQISK
jgi:hypothetical protein